MKKTFAILVALTCSLAGFAQLTHIANGTVDKQAESLLKKAAAKMSGTVSFTVTVQMLDANKKETMNQKAEILYNKTRYRVKAGDIEVYCDGQAVWQYNKNAKEVVVNRMSDSDNDLTNPANILSSYSKNFRAKYIREEDGVAVIDLQPKKSASYHKIRLFIVAKTGLLKCMEQHNYDSSRCNYSISGFKNAVAKDADFIFDAKAHPGVQVVDMR